MKTHNFCVSFLLGIALLFVNSYSLFAQTAAEYSFSQEVATYTPITGGTSLTVNERNQIFDISLPVSFTFLGRSQTALRISTNGHVSFPNEGGLNNVTAVHYNLFNVNLSNTGGAICAFAADLDILSTYSLRYEQVENEFVVQWSDFKRTDVATDVLNFQIRLNTITGTVKVVYGNVIAGIPSGAKNVAVGIRGQNPDFNNRKVISTTGEWINSTRGTLKADNCYFNGTNPLTIPTAGTTFSYSIPACSSIATLSTSGITANSAVISWIAPIVAPIDGYQYYYSTTNVAPTATSTLVNSSSTSETLSNLTSNTTYYVWLRTNCSNGDFGPWSNVLTFRTTCEGITAFPWNEDFEGVTGASGTFVSALVPSCWRALSKAGVMTAGGDVHTTSGSKALVFQYNTEANAWAFTPVFSLVAGQSYRFSFKYRNASIDPFQDFKIFVGTGNLVEDMTTQLGTTISSVTNVEFKTFSVDFTVPANGAYSIGINTTAGRNPMYLSMDDFSFSTSPLCNEPTQFVTDILGANSASISWSAPVPTPALGYEYVYNTTNTVPTSTTTVSTSETPSVIMSNLTESTTYYLWVRSVCSSTEESSWSLAYSFTTTCAAINVPYVQNFESVSTPAIPACTSVENAGNGNVWITRNTEELGTTALEYKYNPTNPANTWFYTPGINMIAGRSYRVSYKYKGDEDNVEKLKVAYGVAPSHGAMTTVLNDHSNIVNPDFQSIPVVVDFSPTTTGIYYVGFQAYSDARNYYLYDITVDLTPTCFEPTVITVSNITTTTATVTWNVPTVVPASGYEYYYSTINYPPFETTTVHTTASATVDLTDLDHSSNYYFWVRSVCGTDDKSVWSLVEAFQTECDVNALPYLIDFGNISVGSTPICTSVEQAGLGNLWTTMLLNSNSTLVYKKHNTRVGNTWFYTNGVNLIAGRTYKVSYKYAAANVNRVESLKVAYGNAQSNLSMTTVLADQPIISNNVFATNSISFSPVTSGVFYIGFNGYSASGQSQLYVDDILIEEVVCLNPTAIVSGDQVSCIEDVFTPIEVALTGTAPWTLTITDGTTPVEVNATTSPYTFTPTAVGTYSVTDISDAVCVGTSTGNAIVSYVPTTTNSSVTICTGDVYVINGNSYSVEGIYNDLISVSDRCDSLVITTLSVVNVQAVGTYSTSTGRLSATPVQNATYTWINCITDDIVSLSESFIPSANGQYKVEVKVGNCTETSTCINVTNLSTTVVSAADIQLFPNPTLDKVTVLANGQLISKISVVDQKGQVIGIYEFNEIQAEVSLGNLSEGLYFLHIESNGSNFVKKITRR